MARQCEITGKKPMSGYNVSHANNRTLRRFLPNLRKTSLYSEALKKAVQLRISVHGLRTIEHKGGFDAYLKDTASSKLSAPLRKLKKQIEEQAA